MRVIVAVLFVLVLAGCGSGGTPPVTAAQTPPGIYIAAVDDMHGMGPATLAFSYDGKGAKSVGVVRIHARNANSKFHGKYKAPYAITASSYNSETGLTLIGTVNFGGVLGTTSFTAVLDGKVVKLSFKDALGSGNVVATYAGPYITSDGSTLSAAGATPAGSNSLLGYWVLWLYSPTTCSVGNYQFPLSCFPWPYEDSNLTMHVTAQQPDGYGGISFSGTLNGTTPEFTAIGEVSAVRPLTGDPDNYAGDWHASVEIDNVTQPFGCYPVTNVLEVGTAQWNPPLQSSGDPGFWNIYQLYPANATQVCGAEKDVEAGASTLYNAP